MREMTTIAALLSLSGARGHLAWATLVDRHGPDVWRIITSRIHDAHLAEDVYQDFWLGLPKAATSFKAKTSDGERSARAWMMCYAYTTSIDHLRRQRSQIKGTITLEEQELIAVQVQTADPSHQQIAAEDEHAQQQLINRVHQIINKLPEGYRRPLLLHLIGGLSYDDVASDLRCTVSNARVRVHRGLKQLRDTLGLPDNDGADRTLAGLIVPIGMLMPIAPAFPLVMAVPIPVATKAVSASSWTQSPRLAVAGASIAGVAVATTVAFHEPMLDKNTVKTTPVPITQTLTLDDFNDQNRPLRGSSYADDPPPTLQFVPVPDNNIADNTALKIGWSNKNTIWVTAHVIKKPDEKIVLQTFDNTTVTLTVWNPDHANLRHFGVRFRDKDGDYYEFRYVLSSEFPAGRQTFTIPLDIRKAKHWSPTESANGELNFPVTQADYGLEVNRRIAPRDGYIIIDDVQVHRDL